MAHFGGPYDPRAQLPISPDDLPLKPGSPVRRPSPGAEVPEPAIDPCPKGHTKTRMEEAGGFAVRCETFMCWCGSMERTEAEAIAAWNSVAALRRRAEEAAGRAVDECITKIAHWQHRSAAECIRAIEHARTEIVARAARKGARDAGRV
jgi:hypothetical protein